MHNETIRRCYLYMITLAVICLLTLLYTTKIIHVSTLDRLNTLCTSKFKIKAWLEEISNKQDLTNMKLYGDRNDNRAFEMIKSLGSLKINLDTQRISLKTNEDTSKHQSVEILGNENKRVDRESLQPLRQDKIDDFSEKLKDSNNWMGNNVKVPSKTSDRSDAEELQFQNMNEIPMSMESAPLRYRKYGDSWLMTKDELLLLRNWCIQRDYRVNWRRILEPCKDDTVWSRYKPYSKPGSITTAWRSYVYDTDIRPAGQYSRFFIQSVAQDGTVKKSGGDSWRVHIQGDESVPVTIMDHKNGVYEVFFLITEPGKYNAEIVLDYTLCDGMKDPPVDWFIKGNYQKAIYVFSSSKDLYSGNIFNITTDI